MIKTLQKKFVFITMVAVTILLVLMLGAINVFNAWTIKTDTDHRIESLIGQPDKGPRSVFDPSFIDDARIPAAFFIVVIGGETGELETNLSRAPNVDELTALRLTGLALQSKKSRDIIEDYKYLITVMPNGMDIKILFLDLSGEYNYFFRVLMLSCMIGAACWGLVFLVVLILSKRAISPIAENIENQKRFVTDAGHEIKTPLAIILANTEAMELFQGESKWSKNIKKQVHRLNGLMQSLLNFEKIEGDRQADIRERVDLSRLLTETIQMFEEPMALNDVSVEKQIENDIRIFASNEQIKQLLSILTDNAVKYALPESVIVVELKRQNQQIVLQMANACEALPDCAPEKLFERFYRGDAARTQKSGGYGIGLSAAKTIVENIGGKIEAVYDDEHFIRFVCRLNTM